MSDISPTRTVSVGEKQYTLDGSFKTLRAVQQRFKQDIIQVLLSVMDMPLDGVADLLALGAAEKDADAIGQEIIDTVGLSSGYIVLKTELYAWLMVALAPKAEREKKAQGVGGAGREGPQPFPWADYQRLALGLLRWQPSEFWGSNVWELTYAWEGFARSKGIPLEGDFMSREELEELKRKFPDKPQDTE